MAFKQTLSAACVALFALSAPVSAEGHASAETVVATVNGKDITLAHMIVLKQRLPAQYQSLPGEVLFEGILDQLVQQTLLGESIEQLSPGSVATLENEERALKASEVIQTISEAEITEEAVEAAYQETYVDGGSASEFNAAHILVATEEEALAIIEELEGGADFATVAQEKSTGPSGPSGGDLGWFGLGQMVAPFEAAVVAMEPGSISAPVQTQFGWHVIKLNDSRFPPLDAVRADLITQLRQVAIEARVAELTVGADISRSTVEDIDPALLDDLSILEN